LGILVFLFVVDLVDLMEEEPKAKRSGGPLARTGLTRRPGTQLSRGAWPQTRQS